MATDLPNLLGVHCPIANIISTDGIVPHSTLGTTTSFNELLLICARTIGSSHHLGVPQHLSNHFSAANDTRAPIVVASLHCFTYAATTHESI